MIYVTIFPTDYACRLWTSIDSRTQSMYKIGESQGMSTVVSQDMSSITSQDMRSMVSKTEQLFWFWFLWFNQQEDKQRERAGYHGQVYSPLYLPPLLILTSLKHLLIYSLDKLTWAEAMTKPYKAISQFIPTTYLLRAQRSRALKSSSKPF